MECRKLFCFCYPRKWDSTQEICTKESTNKDFDHEKEIICCQSCQRKECFFVLTSRQQKGKYICDKGEFQKIWYTKFTDKRRYRRRDDKWSGFAPNSKFTQYNFHYTCNLVLHNALWVSFFFLFHGGNRPLHHDRDKEWNIFFFRKMKVKEDTKNKRWWRKGMEKKKEKKEKKKEGKTMERKKESEERNTWAKKVREDNFSKKKPKE